MEANGFIGGIWILWKDTVQIEIMNVFPQYVHGRAQEEGSTKWLYFTVVYGSPQVTKRKELWDRLAALNPGNMEAWMLDGDFNATLRLEEKQGANRGNGTSKGFQDFIFNSELMVVEFRGSESTWKRENLWKILDRFLFNEKWAALYPMSIVTHLDRVGSDHCPLLFHSPKITGRTSERPFRFIAAWKNTQNFQASTRFSKPKSTAGTVQSSAISENEEAIACKKIYSERLVQLDAELRTQSDEVLEQEKSLWIQKSRQQWIRHGDKTRASSMLTPCTEGGRTTPQNSSSKTVNGARTKTNYELWQ
ncbi:uncharacterized protein LOC120179039 [Hibiscus syriacus]|uniref:uncharacterized protein LOC120179039 n=1 Tax=Hibiscus syriacus TaxID=106335 RepID=UPI00192119FB|nr:uncharacterized protein LOC120179039 [Hibiscus syriacus]